MSHVNNVNFLENRFALLFLHTTENSFRERKEHEMKEWSIPNQYTSLVVKHKCTSPEQHNRTLSASCTDFYEKINSLIIFKLILNWKILPGCVS